MLTNTGRLLILCIWGFLILNLVHPLLYPLNTLVGVALIFTTLIHDMQLTLLESTLSKDGLQIITTEGMRIFLFGALKLLAWQRRFRVKK